MTNAVEHIASVSVDTEDDRQCGSKSYNLRVRCPKTIHYEAPPIGQLVFKHTKQFCSTLAALTRYVFRHLIIQIHICKFCFEILYIFL